MQKTLGGDRLGSGKKMQVELHGYARSTHDLGYVFRSTMAAGTLVPFICEVGLPGDTFDINLECDIKTHPTIGPLFGSYKVQLDVFQCPIRLYQGQLHNNKLGIGNHMANVKLPLIRLTAIPFPDPLPEDFDMDNAQINPSCILAYLGIRGVGRAGLLETSEVRDFNGVPLLAYWDIYKNYYANKQEEIGAVIHTERPALNETVDEIRIGNGIADEVLPELPTTTVINMTPSNRFIEIDWTGQAPILNQIIVITPNGPVALNTLVKNVVVGAGTTTMEYDSLNNGIFYEVNAWRYQLPTEQPQIAPEVVTFALEQIDQMREQILAAATDGSAPFIVNSAALEPYMLVLDQIPGTPVLTNMNNTQEGLGVKTYQSDLFNNWLSTEWIDGANGIAAVTAIDTSGGDFTIDTLNLSKKVYDMLNRIAVSGGTYDDWLDAVYTHDRITRAESPIYHGGLSRELIFQEVVSNASAETQPLGTLAGKGIMGQRKKGGQVTVKVDEPSYILGIVSLTPRIDYSQGNKWDTGLLTMDDLHKPALDEIGFQELITEQMAWWTTASNGLGGWTQKSAGKQPAWINYMTNVNKVYGNFAIANNEMFMTLNRRYEWDTDGSTVDIQDLTTYIDPAKFNFIFAETALDAQNFWTQIGVDMIARRKMSAKVMPNL